MDSLTAIYVRCQAGSCKLPTEPKCSICKQPSTRVAVAERRAKGDSFQQIASRLRLTKSSVHRHAKHAELPGRVKPPGREGITSQPNRRATRGRCKTCGTMLDDPSPKALVKRAERVLSFGEAILQKAIDDEDFRLAMQAIDRTRASLEQLMKVHGLLQPEGSSTTIIDARRQTVELQGRLSEDFLRRIAAGDPEALAVLTGGNRKRDAISGPETLDGAVTIESS